MKRGVGDAVSVMAGPRGAHVPATKGDRHLIWGRTYRVPIPAATDVWYGLHGQTTERIESRNMSGNPRVSGHRFVGVQRCAQVREHLNSESNPCPTATSVTRAIGPGRITIAQSKRKPPPPRFGGGEGAFVWTGQW